MDGIRFPNERHSVLITSNYGNQKADSRQAQLFNGGWEWLDLTRIFALQLSVAQASVTTSTPLHTQP